MKETAVALQSKRGDEESVSLETNFVIEGEEEVTSMEEG